MHGTRAISERRISSIMLTTTCTYVSEIKSVGACRSTDKQLTLHGALDCGVLAVGAWHVRTLKYLRPCLRHIQYQNRLPTARGARVVSLLSNVSAFEQNDLVDVDGLHV